MNPCARAIVIHNGKLLLMHRNKHGEVYDTLVGGHIEPGETPEQAVLRELHEETGVEVLQPRLVFVEEPGGSFGTQYIFLCEYLRGDPALQPDAVEVLSNADGHNLYTPAWLPLGDLPAAPFKSERLKAAILQALQNGFPSAPQTI